MALSDTRRCTATAKRTGQRCRQPAVRGFSVCYLHGAGSPKRRRPGGRPIEHGRYSQRLPERLASRYLEALEDARLLELRDEIALVDVRLAELVRRLPTGESGAGWRTVQTAYALLQDAIRSNSVGDARAAVSAMGSAISAGAQEQALWAEIVALTDHRRKLVESERKRLVEMQQMITSERAMVLLAAIVGIIRKHEPNPHVLAAISADLRALTVIEPG